MESAVTKPRIGFIGLGIMGSPMAGHLAAAGYGLTVFDANAATTQAVADRLGPEVVAAASPSQVAAASDIVMTMLPNGRVVREVALGADGLKAGFRAGALLLDTSSSEPWLTKETAEELRKVGVGMVDAPVSGAQWGAEAAELVFMVGGAEQDVARILPLLEIMGRKTFHLGPVSAGHAMKCINNSITATTLTATTEGLVAGQRYGLDAATMVDVLNESTGGSWVARTHFHKRIFSRAFDDPFKLELMLKDVGIQIDLAKQLGIPVPLAALTEQLWQMANHAAGAGASISEFVRWVENHTDTQLRGNTKT